MTFKFPSTLGESTLSILGGNSRMTPRLSRRSTPHTNHCEKTIALIDDALDILADEDEEHEKPKQIKQ
jgi:hypothetical protein